MSQCWIIHGSTPGAVVIWSSHLMAAEEENVESSRDNYDLQTAREIERVTPTLKG